MKTMEITNVIPETEQDESTVLEQSNATRQQSARAIWEVRLRRAALAVIVVLLTWLTFTIRSSINELDSDVQQIQAQILSWHR